MSLAGQIHSVAPLFNLEPELVSAIVQVESGSQPYKVRYEPSWAYLFNVAQSAAKLGITVDTETVLQKCSWGYMQIMGSVARENGFSKDLPYLTDEFENIYYGCRQLAVLKKRYTEDDLISAYNAGTPRKENGQYLNQAYVDKVKHRVQYLKQNLKRG